MKKIYGILFFLGMIILCGCEVKVIEKQGEKRELPFVILGKEVIPEELKKLIEEKKEEEIKLTYVDEEGRYIIIGYGKQNTGGYSIYIKELYATENAIYVDASLIPPKEYKKEEQVSSYPVMVIQISEMSLPVVFR
ncbi:MAG: protease complex subunit PrcB family protein [Lachnospiraceae bacterium]|nr:protease complex subunit PrcB family protein [Lachnospiraceae bacterium]